MRSELILPSIEKIRPRLEKKQKITIYADLPGCTLIYAISKPRKNFIYQTIFLIVHPIFFDWHEHLEQKEIWQ